MAEADTAMLKDARRALRAALEERGYAVASDSHGLRDGLYVLGGGDLARALFEFMPSAAEACDRMYQGSWGPGMPPRFAVLPASEADARDLEMLVQIRVIPLFFRAEAGEVVFPGLDELLAEHLG